MAEGKPENPLNRPALGKLSPDEAKFQADNLVRRGGEAINPADPDTPTFMIQHQENPGKLPTQEPPEQVDKN